eukprot:9484844-Pyramimonas_sp.AAC.1
MEVLPAPSVSVERGPMSSTCCSTFYVSCACRALFRRVLHGRGLCQQRYRIDADLLQPRE